MVDNSGGGQEVELNLAPIIDCFTVLITYLLVTASFLTFASVDVAISANNDSKQASPPLEDKHPLVMTMDLAVDNQITMKVSGGDLKQDYEVKVPPGKDGSWDAATLGKHLVDITTKWTKLSEVSVSAAPTVQYRQLVNVINATQKTLPKVYISAG